MPRRPVGPCDPLPLCKHVPFAVTLAVLGWWIVGGQAQGQPATAADDIVVLKDLPYREAGSQHCALDLALPKERHQPSPAIVVMHGC